MKKYFVTSDIHSFFMPFKDALYAAGFRKTNKDHILIICGDLFDRGPDTLSLYKFITSLPKKRVILIRGNHEYLYNQLLEKNFPDNYDFSNGTVATFCQIAGVDPERLMSRYYYRSGDIQNYHDTIRRIWSNEILPKVKDSEVTKFINSKRFLDYYELNNYIFVHSFIPTAIKPELIKALGIYAYGTSNVNNMEYDPKWRIYGDFESASWVCPFKYFEAGLFNAEIKNNKTLVVGHWHTSDFYKFFDGNYDAEIEKTCPIYQRDNLIALDACTVLTKRCNIFCFEAE